MADGVALAAKPDHPNGEGARDPPARVNKTIEVTDGLGRTLLAWRRLAAMRRFMPAAQRPDTQPPDRGSVARSKKWDLMNSAERREARYWRRKAARLERKHAALHGRDDFGSVFTYANMYQAYRKCRRNVSWKASAQRYITQAPLRVHETRDELMDGRYKPSAAHEFDLVERGKRRHVRGVGIADRVVQRCLCDEALVPAITRTLIYDNGASTDGKGYAFALERLRQHLREHYRRHGTEGYVLLFDFKGFFDGVSHELAKGCISKELSDPRILELCYALIDGYGDGRGLSLGSQISQVLALASANRLDHHIKESLRVRAYGRYMDDGYLIHESKGFLRRCLAEIRGICTELGLTLNERKTQIVRLTRGFRYLKVRHYLLPSGRVLRKPCKDSASRMRRKLRAFRRKVDDGVMTSADAWRSFNGWRSHLKGLDAHRTIRETERLCMELFGPEGA